ncbi:MAG TPA: MFS transporter [Pirellulales bacterium]|nr:MFS transporter [Pirellulales bacterium]
MQQPTTEKTPAKAATGGGSYKWWVVGMLWFICFFNYADREVISVTFPLLKEQFNFSKTELGWIKSSFMIVYAVSAPFAGQVGDRVSRKLVILSGLYVWSAITGFTALCSRYWQFLFVRASEGLGETFYFPATMSLVSDYHGKKTRSRAMAFHQTGVYAGIIGGGAIGAWMGESYGWQTPFIFLGVAGVLLGFVLTAFIREPVRHAAELAEEETDLPKVQPRPVPIGDFLRYLLTTPTAIVLLIVFPSANFVAWGVLTWMPTYLHEEFGMSVTRAGITGTIYIQVASMCGAVSGGFLADFWRRFAVGGRVATQAAGLLIGAPAVYYCGVTNNADALNWAMIIFGFCKGVYDSNIWAAIYDVIPPARRGTIVGVANFVGWMAGAGGPVLVGLAVDKEWMTLGAAIAMMGTVYVVTGGATLLCALFLTPRDVRRAARIE